MKNKIAMVGLAALLIGGVVVTVTKPKAPKNMSMNGHNTPQGRTYLPSEIKVPAFNLTEKRGEVAYNENCAQCHGEKITGTDQGPPFLHSVYVPNHHGDDAFYRAAQNGVNQHHWPYGDMPAQTQVSPGDLKSIIAYVRALQAANGIF